MTDSDRIAALADECVKCGLCLPHCPTYALDATETESPRGRIALAAGGTSGQLGAGLDLRLHLDHCLGCMACERVCPVPVQYGALLTATRAALPSARRRPRLLLAVLSRPRLLRIGAALARLTAARLWLPALARALPRDSALRAATQLLPTLPKPEPGPPHAPRAAPTPRRGTVALFSGCVASVFEGSALDAGQRLLTAAGFDVVRLAPACCGALARHTGDAARGDALAGRLREAYAASGTNTLLVATPGCLGTLREALPRARVEDVLAFLDADIADTQPGAARSVLRFREFRCRVVLHLPCTQINVARAGGAVQRLLARVPGLSIEVLPTQGTCCGAAGSHMLEFPQRANAFRERVLESLPMPAPDLLLTSNIGCRLHLAAGLAERGAHVEIDHPLTLLARQLIKAPAPPREGLG